MAAAGGGRYRASASAASCTVYRDSQAASSRQLAAARRQARAAGLVWWCGVVCARPSVYAVAPLEGWHGVWSPWCGVVASVGVWLVGAAGSGGQLGSKVQPSWLILLLAAAVQSLKRVQPAGWCRDQSTWRRRAGADRPSRAARCCKRWHRCGASGQQCGKPCPAAVPCPGAGQAGPHAPGAQARRSAACLGSQTPHCKQLQASV